MRRRALALTAGFVLLLALGLARHEMWRDELQAWMLARASPTPPALLANLRYEGHPPLWHLLLLPLAHATARPEALQVLHLAIATLGAALFLLWAPLPWPLRCLFVGSYLPLYEYGVISRNYALALPLLWLLCRWWPQGARRAVSLGAVIALLANANPYAWLLGAAALVVLVAEAAATPARRRELATHARGAAAGGLLALAGLGFAAWRMLPPADALYAGGFHRWWAPRACRALGTALVAYLPLPDWRTVTPWNSAILFRVSPPLLAAAALLWLTAAFLLLGSRRARALFAVGTLALLGFTYGEYVGWARHHGHHFLLFVACCWLAAKDSEPSPRRRRWRLAALAALLAVHVSTGAWLYGADLLRPFSDAEQAAAALTSPPLAALTAVGYPDPPLAAVGAYRGAPLLSLASGRPLEFVQWRLGADKRLSRPELCARLAVVARRRGGAVAFVAPPAVLAAPCPGLAAEPFGDAPLPLVPSEQLAVWRVTVR